MKKLLKKLGIISLILMLVFSLGACGEDSTGNKDDGQKSSAQMTEDDYKAKVEEIYNSITVASQEAMTGIDTTDLEATVTATKSLLVKVRPLYEELGGLNAPDAFKSSQEKIKTGADASLELLDLSAEMFDMQANPDQEKISEKLTELTEQMANFQTKAQDLATGLEEVMGAV